MSAISQAHAPLEFRKAKTASEHRPGGGWVRALGRGVSYVLLLVAGFAALAMIVVPMATGSQTYTVLTSSMAPKYAPGTFLAVKPTPFDELRVGDIITYQIESGKADVITHRIMSVGATQEGGRVFTTKGDNNSLADPAAVQEVQVKGKLFYAIPYVGFAANAVGQERDVILPILAVGFIAFGALSMTKGLLDKKRAKNNARHSL